MSISSMTSSMPMQSPRARMDARIAAATSAGEISSTDQTALSSALDTIDKSLSGTKPSGDMKTRIDGLIDEQVNSGTLSEEQAAELKSFFAQGGPPPGGGAAESSSEGSSETEGVEGCGGPRGPGGPPPGPPPSDEEDDDSDTTDADATTAQLDALMAFIEQLRASVVSNSTYGSTSASSAGLVLNGVA